MIYAFREGKHSRALVEFRSRKELDDTNAANAAQGGAEPPFTYRPASREEAHRWVRQGNTHETGLWLDGGRIRYAPADPEGH